MIKLNTVYLQKNNIENNMEAAFYYEVKVKLIRYETKDNIDFINYNKIFKNENPIIARIDAFNEYDGWIKDLYAGIGLEGKYKSDKQARIDLQKFITLSDKSKIQIDNNEIDLNKSYNFGIGVYFIIEKPIEGFQNTDFTDLNGNLVNFNDKKGDEELIHGIGTNDNYNDPTKLDYALFNEITYYDHYNYDKNGLERKVDFYDYWINEVEEIRFLETPFDWTGLDEVPIEQEIEIQESKNVNVILEGEGNAVEFKPALLYNFKTGKGGISVKAKIATAICAFLNSNGGILYIGLNDDGMPIGLDNDFSLSNGKKPKDYFQNEFDQMIEHFLSFSVKSNIIGCFDELNGKDIFVVTVEPIFNKTIFLNSIDGKEFWVRGNAGNRKLPEINQIVDYCLNRQKLYYEKQLNIKL